MTYPPDDISDFVDVPSKPKKSGGIFTVGKLLAAVGMIGILIALLLPASRSARPAARRAQCVLNLKVIALGLRNYESAYNALAPAYTVDAAGKPLHSWRTLILPYLDQEALYETIDLSKPWNDPANAKAHESVILTYHCPDLTVPATNTTYLAIVGPDNCFLPEKSRPLSEITDEHLTTLMVIEAPSDQAVHWMSPNDADESLVMRIGPQSKLNHSGSMNAAFVDGSTRTLRVSEPAAQRRAMMSIAGGDNPRGW